LIEVLQDRSGALVLAPSGDICPLTAPALECCIDGAVDAGARHLVIDLTDVTLLTAAGVSALVAGANRLSALDGQLTIRNATGLTARVLTITGLDRYVDHTGGAAGLAQWN
jgi:anti-sigma B factor antagonist